MQNTPGALKVKIKLGSGIPTISNPSIQPQTQIQSQIPQPTTTTTTTNLNLNPIVNTNAIKPLTLKLSVPASLQQQQQKTVTTKKHATTKASKTREQQQRQSQFEEYSSDELLEGPELTKILDENEVVDWGDWILRCICTNNTVSELMIQCDICEGKNKNNYFRKSDLFLQLFFPQRK